MKKTFFIVAALVVSIGLSYGQTEESNYLDNYPNREGAQLVSKSYDANDNLLSTLILTVQKYYQYPDGSDLEMGYVITDAQGKAVDRGEMNVRYSDGDLFFKMSERTDLPDMNNYLSMNTSLMGSFLDYPDTFRVGRPTGDPDSEFEMEAATFRVKDEGSRKTETTFQVYDREFEGLEKITTPAGTFDSSKITFKVSNFENGQKRIYEGTEWYVIGLGIVRAEIYDQNKELKNYTVLTSVKE